MLNIRPAPGQRGLDNVTAKKEGENKIKFISSTVIYFFLTMGWIRKFNMSKMR